MDNYKTILDKPILYESVFDDDSTQGLVTLADATKCEVTFTTNQFPTLSLTYPRTGVGAQLLDYGLIILTDVSPKWVHQKFRIVSIQRDIDNYTITANHVAADLMNRPIMHDLNMPSATPTDVANAVIDDLAGDDHQFYFDSDVNVFKNVSIPSNNASNIFIDPDQQGDNPTASIIGLYGGELEFDNRTIHHYKKAGNNSGIVIQYGKNLQTISDNTDLSNTYTAIFPYAKYTPGQPKADMNNVDWSNWDTDYQSIGTVTYSAGGAINVYDSPVTGHHVIGTLNSGKHVTLGTAVKNGQLIPNPANPNGAQLEVDTVNGNDWYPIQGGGWIDSAWINFDKSGDYLVNPVTGHATIQGSGTDKEAWSNRYQINGKAKVDYKGKKGGIQVYYSPEIGDDHYATGEIVKYGTLISYDWIDINAKGDKWYRIGSHRWLYGPHLSISGKSSSITMPTKAEANIPNNTTVYHQNKKGEMVKSKDQLTSGKSSNEKYRYVKNKKGKKVKVKNPAYHASKTSKKKSKHSIDKTMVSAGVTYVHTSGGWVKEDDVKYTKKPVSPDDYQTDAAQSKSKVEMYDSPDHLNALNWSIPSGTSLAIDGYEAQGADGKNYVQVTYAGKTGWVREDFLNYNGDLDAELQGPTGDSGEPGTELQGDSTEVTVEIGTVYASNSLKVENSRIKRVDLSQYFLHDDEDLSGQQADGTFKQTDADAEQLQNLAENYIKEYDIGEVDDNFTVTATDQPAVLGSLATLCVYDYVDVEHDQIGIHNPGEVTTSVWDCLAHRNTSITVGNPPKTWQHLLLDAAKKDTDQLKTQTNNKINQTNQLFDRLHNIVSLNDQDRQAAEKELADDLNAGRVSVSQIDSHVQDINSTVQNVSSIINSGGSSVLQFYPNYQQPTEIRARTSGGYLRINSDGLGYVSDYGTPRAAITYDGQLVAESITAGTIQALTLRILTVVGGMHINANDNYNTQVDIGNATANWDSGTVVPPADSDNGYHGVMVSGTRYAAQLSQGGVYVKDAWYDTESHFGPNTGYIGDSSNTIITTNNLKSHLNSLGVKFK